MLLRLADPDERYAAVRLCSDLPLPDGRLRPPRRRVAAGARRGRRSRGWSTSSRSSTTTARARASATPATRTTAPGAFGEKSVLLLPGYARAALARARRACPAQTQELAVTGAGSARRSHVSVWSPADAGPGEPLPLLVAHDGPEYDRLAGLTHFAAAGIARGALPRHRVALLAPGERNEWYSASARYAGALVRDVLPAIRSAVGVARPGRRHGREPRRARDAARAAPASRDLRRAVPAVGQLLHAAVRLPGVAASRATSGSCASCARRCARGRTQSLCPSC